MMTTTFETLLMFIVATAAVSEPVRAVEINSYEGILVSVVAILAMLASGAALFVSMSVKSALLAFRVEFMRELDERYLRTKEYNKSSEATALEESHFREGMKEKIEDVQTEVFRIRDTANELREIVAIIRLKPDMKSDKRARSDTGRD